MTRPDPSLASSVVPLPCPLGPLAGPSDRPSLPFGTDLPTLFDTRRRRRHLRCCRGGDRPCPGGVWIVPLVLHPCVPRSGGSMWHPESRFPAQTTFLLSGRSRAPKSFRSAGPPLPPRTEAARHRPRARFAPLASMESGSASRPAWYSGTCGVEPDETYVIFGPKNERRNPQPRNRPSTRPQWRRRPGPLARPAIVRAVTSVKPSTADPTTLIGDFFAQVERAP